MIRKYKVFGLAVMAMFAFGAFMAQGASAVPLTCEGLAVGATCYTSGDQDGGTHVFKSSGGTVSCTEASFAGTGAVAGAGGAVNEQTVTPSYPTEKSGGGSNCTGFLSTAHVKMNECTYTFTTPAQIAGQPTGTVTFEAPHVVCPTGKEIEITPTSFGTSICTQKIPPQTPTGGHIIGKNVEGSNPMDVTLEITLTGIHYTGDKAPCGNGTTQTDGTLTGNSTVKCYSDPARTKQIGCTFS